MYVQRDFTLRFRYIENQRLHVTKIFRLFTFDILIPYKGKCSNLYKVLDF